jgi:hypothetical protein
VMPNVLGAWSIVSIFLKTLRRNLLIIYKNVEPNSVWM